MRGEGCKRPRFAIWLGGVIQLCALGFSFGPDHFPLVTVRAFLIPLAAFLLLLALWLLKKRFSWIGFGSILAALLLLVQPARVFLHEKDGGELVALWGIAQMNVHEANTDVAEVVATARASEADLLSLQEVDARWMEQLVIGLSDLYPWYIHGEGERNYGIALFSKMPLSHAEVIDLEGLPAMRAEVVHHGVRVLVLAAHLRAPESAAKLSQRNAQWIALSRMVRNSENPVCLVGDLNTVPWDDAFQHYLASSAMHGGPSSMIPTWPVISGIAVIPLDHILTSSELYMDGIRAFKIPGSDHLGIWTRMQIGSKNVHP